MAWERLSSGCSPAPHRPHSGPHRSCDRWASLPGDTRRSASRRTWARGAIVPSFLGSRPARPSTLPTRTSIGPHSSVRPAVIPLPFRRGRTAISLRLPCRLERLSHCGAVQIRRPVRVPVVAGPAPPDGQEHLLMHVVGQIGVAENAQSGIEDLSAVLVHQVFKVLVRQCFVALRRKRFQTMVRRAAAEISARIEKPSGQNTYRKMTETILPPTPRPST
jgi:hypothetical protein